MSQITIQCRLVASKATRQHLWHLMAQQNTPLINELLKQVAEHPDFETWRQKGKLPAGIVSKLCNPLKQEARFKGQPARRDLTGERWLETLLTAANTVPKDKKEAKSWQDILLTQSKLVPFPVNYETNEDLKWNTNEQGRLCVRFSGLGDYTFEVYCDQRQLKWFQRFYEDQETKRASKNQHSSSLFTLRSARLIWQEGTGNGQPWEVNHLSLYCTVDTRLWTTEGTEAVREEKASEVAKILTQMNEKQDLTKNQQAFIKRKTSTLERLNNPFPRPSKLLYQGQPHLLLGVALGLEKPATVAIVDAIKGKATTYRSIKQHRAVGHA